MKQQALLIAGILACSCFAHAANDIITLDLTKATTTLEFNADNGSWTGTYDDDIESIESQCFSFIKNSYGSYKTWWGITASKSADNKPKTDVLTYQFSNMALGGIVLNDDGSVKKNEFGAPVTSPDVPYLVCYGGKAWGPDAVDMVFNDGKLYEPVGMYVNLNSYTYYSNMFGQTPARAFTNGDKFTLTVHGFAADETEKTVDVDLASCENGNLTQAMGWVYVDLSSLGAVNEMTFTFETTDTGAYGQNTPTYFCMDKLMVKQSSAAAADNIIADDTVIRYDRPAGTVTIEGADFMMIRNTAGQTVMSGEGRVFDISGLPSGVYIIRAGNRSLKIIK